MCEASPRWGSCHRKVTDEGKYIAKMPVSGNANIYWEHLNYYDSPKLYGLLLYNSNDAPVSVTINKKSGSYYDEDNNVYLPTLVVWEHYKDALIMPDWTGISKENNELTIEPNSSKWIYLDEIPGVTSKYINTLFNGIINLSVHNNMTLECYAFMVTRGEQYANLEMDVNINNYYPKSQNEVPGIINYEQADMGGQLSGTTDAPYLVSGDIDLEGRGSYRLLLTGYDAPLINEGEKSGLKYNGEDVTVHNYGENCTNFSVIYKLNIKNFSGGKMILEYSPYTNPNYYIDKENGVYVAAYVKNSKYYTANLLIAKRQTELEFELEQGANEIYLVVSGMSSLPLTVRLEAK